LIGKHYKLFTEKHEHSGTDGKPIQVIDFSKLSTKELSNFDSVVLLAGHSSVKMCVNDWQSTFYNNVLNFVSLANKIKATNKPIKLIFASSSSVYGNTFGEIADEEYVQKSALNEYDASKIMLELAAIQEKQIEWYGLRFGTVNGFSENFRSELMINSMYSACLKTSVINVTNPTIHRSILDIKDLCRAIEVIMDKGDISKTGFYNLSSFNASVDEIATVVSSITNSSIVYKEDLPKPYDFKTTNAKFESVFDFKFTGTISSIVKDLSDNFSNIKNFGNRNINISYWG
jgi:nucleoside-diphosphate-sugar epimerase